MSTAIAWLLVRWEFFDHRSHRDLEYEQRRCLRWFPLAAVGGVIASHPWRASSDPTLHYWLPVRTHVLQYVRGDFESGGVHQ
jgi:hypothetical protein